MTERLYYDDAGCREFDATVTRVGEHEGQPAVWLDRSAFYPTSGGQPFDTGTLAGLRVVDVIDEEDEVLHVVEGGEVLRPGEVVHGVIDWPRRFDHMQQHTGQHVLSAALAHGYDVPTISFHLGHDASTIDIARELSPDELAAVEQQANRVVWENRAVTVRYADAVEAGALGLRKASQRGGTLRLVDVTGFDLSACGGSHVSQTGAIGAIVIRSWERFKGGQRLEFLCGGRAVQAHGQLRDIVTASVRLVSVLPHELPGAIARLQDELRQDGKALAALRAEVALAQAEALARSAEPIGSVRWLFHAVDGDPGALKSLAQALVSRPGLAVVLTSTTTPALLVVARSADVPVQADAVVKALTATFGGRGGGKPDLAQAGKLEGEPDAILARAREVATA